MKCRISVSDEGNLLVEYLDGESLTFDTDDGEEEALSIEQPVRLVDALRELMMWWRERAKTLQEFVDNTELLPEDDAALPDEVVRACHDVWENRDMNDAALEQVLAR